MTVDWVIRNYGELFEKFQVSEEMIREVYNNDIQTSTPNGARDWVFYQFGKINN